MKTTSETTTTLLVYTVGIVGALLIVCGMVWILRSYTRPAPVNQARIEERRKALEEVMATREQLETYGWVGNKTNGVARIPIREAMELEIREFQNPAAGRSNLLSRVEKAFPPPPPPPPAAPNPFE